MRRNFELLKRGYFFLRMGDFLGSDFCFPVLLLPELFEWGTVDLDRILPVQVLWRDKMKINVHINIAVCTVHLNSVCSVNPIFINR